MSKPGKQPPSFIAPERLYTLKGFQTASGMSTTRLFEARKIGIVLPRIILGKRHFVRGSDAIAFIERLAENAQSN
jgi:hypothetical protein